MREILIPYEWSEAKRWANGSKHGVDFDDAVDPEWHRSIVEVDTRRAYGEHRSIRTAPIAETIHVLVYAFRGEGSRVISRRRAGRQERSDDEQQVAG